MPKKYGNRIKVNSATTGTGVISLGTAVEGYQNFSSGGITDGSSVSYVIEDGANFEIGVGTYTASGTTLSRTVSESTNSNNAINLSGEAVIFITPAASDLPFTDGASFSGAVTFAEDVTFDGATAGRDVLFDRSENKLNFANDTKLTFGSGDALTIQKIGTGGVQALAVGYMAIKSDTDMDFKVSNSDRMTLRSGGSVDLYYSGSRKFETTSDGINVTGTVTDDGAVHDGDVTFTGASYSAVWDKSDNALEFAMSAKAKFNSNLEIFGGTHSEIHNTASGNQLIIRQNAPDQDINFMADSGNGSSQSVYIKIDGSEGEVQLYHYGNEKLATKSTGVTVTGNIVVSGAVDGRDVAADGTKLDGITAGADVTPSWVPSSDPSYIGAAGGTFTGAVTFSSSGNEFSNGVTFSNQNTIFSAGANFSSGNVLFGNNDTGKLLMGGSSLQIGGNSSYYGNRNIIDSGLDLKFLMGNTKTWGIYEANASDKMMEVHEGGGIDLYYNRSKKLEVTNTGATVTGNIVATGTVDGRDIATDGTKLDGIAAGANVGIGSLAADTSPQLGGVLDVNGQAIDFGDDEYLRLGANNEHRIYHKGSGSVLRIEATSAGKSIEVRGGPSSNSFFSVLDANGTNIIKATMNGSSSGVTLHHGGGTKLATSSSGITVTGTLAATAITGDGSGLTNLPAQSDNTKMPLAGGTFTGDVTFTGASYNAVWDKSANSLRFTDNAKAVFGDGSDASIHWNGSALEFSSELGDVLIRGNNEIKLQAHTGENFFVGLSNGASTLYYDNSAKLATSAAGVTVTGTLAATAVTGDGSGLTNLPAGASNVGNGNFIGGTDAGANLESGAQANTLLGNNAGNDITSGRYNTLVGKDTGPLLTTSQGNTFVGWESGKNATTGGANTFLGYRAGEYTTTGFSNVFVGYKAGDGSYGTANTGQYNTAIGRHALGVISSGINNVAIGSDAGDTITSGSRNIVIGQGADASSATISNEITIGSQNHTRFRMPGVQHLAANGSVLQYNSATGLIGLSELQTDLIYDASPQLGGNLDTRTHNINFPQLNSSSMSSNYLSFGGKFFFVCQQGYNRIISDSSSTGFEIKGNVMKLMTATGNEEYLLATKDGSVKLYYDGSSKFETTSTGITVTGDVNSTSDIRAKKNIETIEDALEKVSLLRGVTFDWDNDVEERATGVIAQDVEKVLPEAVRDNAETGFKSVAYGNMVGLLVEAIKEQQTQIDELKDQVKKLNG